MAEKRPKIYSIDFDNTIVRGGKFPEIGEPVAAVVEYIKKIQERGDQWLLWTNREGEPLDMALKWLEEHGLHPTEVNDNLPQMKAFFHGNPRKPFANVCIDDLNAGGLYLPPLDGGMDFGSAIRHLKLGFKVARKDWPGTYIWLLPEAQVQREWCRDRYLLDAMGASDTLKCNGCIRMYCEDGSVTSGWVPSQRDMLAEDWMLVEGASNIPNTKDYKPTDDAGKNTITPPPADDRTTKMNWKTALVVMQEGGHVRLAAWPPDKYHCMLRKEGVPQGGCLVDQLTAEATDLTKEGEKTLCCVINGVVVPGWSMLNDPLEVVWLRAD